MKEILNAIPQLRQDQQGRLQDTIMVALALLVDPTIVHLKENITTFPFSCHPFTCTSLHQQQNPSVDDMILDINQLFYRFNIQYMCEMS